MTRILGIDPGLNATGWGLLEIASDGAVGLRWGTIRPPEGPLSERLNGIYWRVRELIDRHQPDALAIERPFNHRNVKTAVTLGQAEAAAMIAAAGGGITVHEYPPRKVKEAVGDLGSAEKSGVKRSLMAELGISDLDASEDAADALAVAYCHYVSSRSEARLRFT